MRKMLIIWTDIISDRENKYNTNWNAKTDLQNLKEFCDNEIKFWDNLQPIYFQIDWFNNYNNDTIIESLIKLFDFMNIERPEVLIVFSKDLAQKLVFADIQVIWRDEWYSWLERIKESPSLWLKFFAASPIISFSYFTFSKDRIFNLKNTFQGIIKWRYNNEEHFKMLSANYENWATLWYENELKWPIYTLSSK
jgi:hypothetical protein